MGVLVLCDTLKEGAKTNWIGCEEIEAISGKVGGRPMIKGTRVEPM
jgi:hypothetical protein